MVTLVLMCVSILQWFEQRLGHCYLGCQGVYLISTTLDRLEAILRVSDFANFSMETHIPNSSGIWHGKYMPILCQEYMLFFCLPLSIQPRLNTQQQGRARGGGATPGARAPVVVC